MLERKYESPSHFFKSFVITYILIGVAVYFADSIFKVISTILSLLPINNYYVSYAITQVILCLVSVLIIWFSLKQTYKEMRLKITDANKVFKYFLIMMIIFFALSVSVNFIPNDNFGRQMIALILNISETIIIAMSVLSSVLVYGVSIFFFRMFLIKGATEENKEEDNKESIVEGQNNT
ncbi:MAG: hypothetical protein ACM3UU_06640 [Ignavibacteriales bacterium]